MCRKEQNRLNAVKEFREMSKSDEKMSKSGDVKEIL